MQTLNQWLAAVARRREGLAFAEPFSLTLDDQMYAGATDGHSLVLVRGVSDLPLLTENEAIRIRAVIPRAVAPVPVDLAALRAFLDAPPLDPPTCEDCEDTLEYECGECLGAGGTPCTCTCGHDHTAECETCLGEGVSGCPSCWPATYPAHRVRIAGRPFNATLFQRALRRLPDAPATWDMARNEEHAGVLRTPEWLLVVMPLTQQSTPADVPAFPIGVERAA